MILFWSVQNICRPEHFQSTSLFCCFVTYLSFLAKWYCIIATHCDFSNILINCAALVYIAIICNSRQQILSSVYLAVVGRVCQFGLHDDIALLFRALIYVKVIWEGVIQPEKCGLKPPHPPSSSLASIQLSWSVPKHDTELLLGSIKYHVIECVIFPSVW